jgi:hypothetical protein
MFSGLFFGAFFLITGLIGYRIGRRGAWLAESRWAGEPILGQILWGVALLALGIYMFRRLGFTRWVITTGGQQLRITNVGRGRSSGAARADERRALPDRT